MRSKTSFCNTGIFRKNMARFAPLWVLYTLGLLLGLALMYVNDLNSFWFASNMGEMVQYGSLINFFYAPAVAMLLFGDLYNSRMCNALHAMPIRRGTWFRTNVITGLLFSLIPTAIFCAASIPLLMRTCVVDSWYIALWAFLGMNLSFVCFFGIAAFCALCAGNRFAMLAVYAILNGGAFVVYFLVDTIYTPMLYGVITPTGLVEILTPIGQLAENACIELENYWDVVNRYAGREAEMQANWFLHYDGWMTQGIWAAVGVVFTVLAWMLYRKRKLECAGDTMATKALEPVFQIAISICAAAFFSILTSLFIGTLEGSIQYLFLGSGLVVGWFAGRMLIERTVRVFRFKNFLGLAALTVVLAGTLVMTHYDVLGIETRTPAVEDVKSVTFGYGEYRGMSEELTEDADIAEVIRLHKLALEDRLETRGSYVIIDGERVQPESLDKDALKEMEYVYSTTIYIHYTLENSQKVSREYVIWGDGETGKIVNEYLSRWDVVRGRIMEEYAIPIPALEETYDPGEELVSFGIQGSMAPKEYRTEAAIQSLMDAVRADCADRTMTQRETFHSGHFRQVNENGETEYFRSIWIDFTTASGQGGNFCVYPDSANTLAWLWERGLIDFTVHAENGCAG